jgi:RNA polymerase sigma-70 factor (ECF subfamily)
VAAIGESSAQMALRDPDIRLMLRVRADEPGAFEELVRNYQQRLIAVLHHLVGSAEEAEDLAQEAFLRVFRARHKYKPKARFSTWLFTIANHLAMNALRSRRRKPAVPLPASDSGPLGPRPAEVLVRDGGPRPSGALRHRELVGVIEAALAGLNERQRLAVVLNKYEDMNYQEIAAVLGLTVQAVKSLLSRARAGLRLELQKYMDLDGQALPDE